MFLKEVGGNRNLIITPGIGRGKMVFTLLNEVIAVHIKLTIIYVRGSNFKRRFLRYIIMILGKRL